MPRTRTRWWIAPLLALLLAPAASAAGHSASQAGPQPGVLSRLFSFLTPWFPSFPSAWAKEGCKIDPLGRCLDLARTENGCKIDPNGRCLDAARAEEGCAIDAHGRCQPPATLDAGCAIDPHGLCIPGQ